MRLYRLFHRSLLRHLHRLFHRLFLCHLLPFLSSLSHRQFYSPLQFFLFRLGLALFLSYRYLNFSQSSLLFSLLPLLPLAMLLLPAIGRLVSAFLLFFELLLLFYGLLYAGAATLLTTALLLIYLLASGKRWISPSLLWGSRLLWLLSALSLLLGLLRPLGLPGLPGSPGLFDFFGFFDFFSFGPGGVWPALLGQRMTSGEPLGELLFAQALLLFFSFNAALVPPAPSSFRERPIIFYDGICALCSRSVKFLIGEDQRQLFRFAPLQGRTAGRLLAPEHRQGPTSIVYYEKGYEKEGRGESLLFRSAALLEIGEHLGGMPRLIAKLARPIPASLRNTLYDLLASCRYRLFGRYDSCPLPEEKERHLFLD